MGSLSIGQSLTQSGDMDALKVELVLLAQLQCDRCLFGEIGVAAGFVDHWRAGPRAAPGTGVRT